MLTCLYCEQKNHKDRQQNLGDKWICPACRTKFKAVGDWFCLPPNKLLEHFDFREEKPTVAVSPGLPAQLMASVLEVSPKNPDTELQSMTPGNSFTTQVTAPVLVPYGQPFWITLPSLGNQVLEELFRVELLTVVAQTEHSAVLELFVYEQIPIEQLPDCFSAVPLEGLNIGDFHQSFSQRSMTRYGNIVRFRASCQDGSTEAIIVEANDAAMVVYYQHGFFQETETRVGNVMLPRDFYRQLIDVYQKK